ncbi:Protein MS5 [Arabidopsis thaliana x Arabidopsis arenosa]|uniref:Protein MS5 n=1 Tax=Arabidopsis thaliana x Arabidopsis arenosa TaxID=1240361 RepID=A0A8T1Y3W8_9BRAS|nr:Protein MS5 [Arabidopsis thaliana x Arabidopsis arenosa]
MEAVCKRKFEETTVSHDVASSGFISEEEWSAAVNNDPPSGWTDEDDDDHVVCSSFVSNEEWSAAVKNDPPSGWTDEDDDDDHDVVSSGFISKDEWSAAVNNDPPSGWTDEDDDDVVTDLEQELYRQIRESDGFDVDIRFPSSFLYVYKCANNDDYRDADIVGICARVGLHWYNFHKGSNLEFMHVDKYNSRFCALMTYHITAEAIDPANDSRFTFQTCATRTTCKNDEDLRILTEVCRIKPKIQGTGDILKRWNDEAIDDIYKGNLPEWISDDALIPCSEQDQFYEVQESDIQEHNWLNLYTEIASYSLWEGDMRLESCVPVQIMKVIVETREAVESKEKLMAGNAIFYISFRVLNAPHGPPQDHRAIVRRTVDGIPGHVCLEFKCWLKDL